MNAAARAINQSNLFSGHLFSMRISKQLGFVLAFLLAILISGLAVIYITNEQRLTLSALQQLEHQNNQLKLQWGQLLLEQASLATSARVEKLAIEKLGMQIANPQQTFILKAK
jgi:cell division protein FtsL